MAQYGCWRQPRCLVNDGGDGSIGVDTATLEALSRITDPVDVVCILGGYRTGKSYLMNWFANATATNSNATGSYYVTVGHLHEHQLNFVNCKILGCLVLCHT